MGLIQNIKNYFDERRRIKLRNDLKVMAAMDFQYNPFKYSMPEKLRDLSSDINNLLERLVWFTGDGEIIHDFYKKRITTSGKDVNVKDSYFWVSCPPKMRHVHSGLPQLISETMGFVLFGNGIKIKCEIKDEKGKALKNVSKEAEDLVNKLVDELKLMDILISAATTNSWSGHVDFKLSYDLNLSYKPIIESYDRRFFQLVKFRGVTLQHVFMQWFKKVDKKSGQECDYLLEETYGKDEQGNATIENKLYELRLGGQQKKEVPLKTIPETSDFNDGIVTLGIKGLAAFDVPNLPKTNVLVNYPYGKSDYEGAIDLFDTIDEDVTQIVSEIRDKKPIREWDERALDIDENGNKSVKEYITNYLAVKEPNAEGSVLKQVTEFTDQTTNHVSKFNTHLAMACAKVKISPISLGIPGLIAIDSSDKSTREKSKVTTDTRKTKIKIWQPFLKEFIPQILRFAKWITTIEGYDLIDDDKAREWKKKLDSLDLDKIEITVSFPDYLVDAKEGKIQTMSAGVTGGVISLETAIEEIHGDDWTAEQKQDEVNRILIRRGMATDMIELEQLENGQSGGVNLNEDSIIDQINNKATDPNRNI